MSFESQFSKDNWHRGVPTIALRNAIRSRRWGMRVTVFNAGGSSGEYVLSYNETDTNLQNNANWLKVADIGVPWGGGSFALTNGNATTANGTAVDLGGEMTDDVTIDAIETYGFSIVNSVLITLNANDGVNEARIEIAPASIAVGTETMGITIDPPSGLIQISSSPSDITVSAVGIFIQTTQNINLNASLGLQLVSSGGDEQCSIVEVPSQIDITQSSLEDETAFQLRSGVGFTTSYQRIGEPETAQFRLGSSDTGTGAYIDVVDPTSGKSTLIALQEAQIDITSDLIRLNVSGGGNFSILGLPTSNVGLSPGDVWINGTSLDIVT